MLIDRWLEFGARSARVCPAAVEFFSTYRQLPQRFEFSDEAVAMAAGLARDYPDLLLRNYQFATPPYRTTYVEYNTRVWAEAYGRDKYAHVQGPMDDRAGHLIHDGIAATVASATAGGDVDIGPCPWMYAVGDEAQRLFAPIARKQSMVRLRFTDNVGVEWGAEKADLCTATVALGSHLIHNPKAHLTAEVVSDIHERVAIWFERSVHKQGVQLELIKNFAGELRTLWLLLLLIHQPQHIHFDDIAASRRMVGNKPVATPSYRLVRIKPKTTVHHISRAMQDRMKPGLHQVREFWRNFDKNDNCEHAWPLLPDEWGQFHCQRCSQWRVRVKQHERGDPTRPVIRKGYKV